VAQDDDELDQVIGHERRLLDPRVRASAEAVTALLHDEFREFGASGRVWDRASIVPAVTADPGADPTVGEMTAVRLAPDVILLTYCVTRPRGRTLRSSVWLRDPAGWRLYFHQGTLQL
jgi:ribonuclease HI